MLFYWQHCLGSFRHQPLHWAAVHPLCGCISVVEKTQPLISISFRCPLLKRFRGLHSSFNHPVWLWAMWRWRVVFKLPVVGKSCVFSTVKLWAIVCVHSVRNTITCKMLFCPVDDCLRGGLRQLFAFPVSTECFNCYQIVVTFEAVQVFSHYTSRSARRFRSYQRLFRLCCLVRCTERWHGFGRWWKPFQEEWRAAIAFSS